MGIWGREWRVLAECYEDILLTIRTVDPRGLSDSECRERLAEAVLLADAVLHLNTEAESQSPVSTGELDSE